jgi:hypothetical protein
VAEPEPKEPEGEFIAVLEKGVRDVLKNRKTTPSERIAAIGVGAKVLMIKFKISGNDEKSFFDQ